MNFFFLSFSFFPGKFSANEKPRINYKILGEVWKSFVNSENLIKAVEKSKEEKNPVKKIINIFLNYCDCYKIKKNKPEKKPEKKIFLKRGFLNKDQEKISQEKKKKLIPQYDFQDKNLLSLIEKEPCLSLKMEGEILNYNNQSYVDGQITLGKTKDYYDHFLKEDFLSNLKNLTENQTIENFFPIFLRKYGVDEVVKVMNNHVYDYLCQLTNNVIKKECELFGFCKKPISLYPVLTMEEIAFLCKVESLSLNTIFLCLGYPTVINVKPGTNRKFFFEFPVIVKNEGGPSYIFSLSVKCKKEEVTIFQAKKNFLSSPIYYEKKKRKHLNELTEFKKRTQFLTSIQQSNLKIETILNNLGDYCIYSTNGERCVFVLFDQYFCQHKKQTNSIFCLFLYNLDTLQYEDSFCKIESCTRCFG